MSQVGERRRRGRAAAIVQLPRPRERRARGTSRPRGVRDVMRALHRYIGLLAGVVLVVTGLTGSALVFRAEIDRALNPHLLTVVPGAARASLQGMYDAVVARHADDPVPARVRMPRDDAGAIEFWMGLAPDRYVYADPYTGRVIGARRPTEFLTGWLFLLHSHMLSGELGHAVAGVAALMLMGLSISGIVVWWPRRAPWTAWAMWRAALRVERGAGGKRFTYDLHRAIGFYGSILLLMAGTTGASLVFHEKFERLAHLVMGTRAAPVPSIVVSATPAGAAASLPIDSLLAVAERALPGGYVSYLYLPTKAGETFRVRKRLPAEEHPNGKSFVHVDPSTGTVLAVEDGTRAPRGARLYSILYPLHIGILGGTATRVLVLLVGLSLPVLAVTGVLVWWRKGRKRG